MVLLSNSLPQGPAGLGWSPTPPPSFLLPYSRQVPANRLGHISQGGPFAAPQVARWSLVDDLALLMQLAPLALLLPR